MPPIDSSKRRTLRWGRAVVLGLTASAVAAAATVTLAPPDDLTAYLVSRPIDCSAVEDDASAEVLHANYRDDGLEHLSYTVGIHPAGPIAPTVAVRAFDGWLLGRDHGEFGGELVYRDGSGHDRVLANINIKDIHPVPQGFVVAAGRGFMDSVNGAGSVIRVARDTQGELVTTAVELPGAPISSWRLASGALLIRTLEKHVLVPAGGDPREVNCRVEESGEATRTGST